MPSSTTHFRHQDPTTKSKVGIDQIPHQAKKPKLPLQQTFPPNQPNQSPGPVRYANPTLFTQYTAESELRKFPVSAPKREKKRKDQSRGKRAKRVHPRSHSTTLLSSFPSSLARLFVRPSPSPQKKKRVIQIQQKRKRRLSQFPSQLQRPCSMQLCRSKTYF
ncbi:hypothetical protein K402DRAFT_206223 [Aulographum hederae CBS 113979]|uniref:Uncharacterized protein n=1 Tax=Aulographum hederae CBS 113979 TaxID=1176131 RepID=A0A6G1GN32_9PEZI|nr:hypothetical protein K402DRAFT_206223 [Aulographum hederae CBS 113979]